MCWRITTCSSSKGFARTWICAILVSKPIPVVLKPALFLSCYYILVILCCNCSRVENPNHSKSQVHSRDLASPSMPYSRDLNSANCGTLRTLRKDFLDFAGLRIEIQSCSETHLKDFDLDSKSIGPKDSIINHPSTKILGRLAESSTTTIQLGWTLPASCKHHRGRPAS